MYMHMLYHTPSSLRGLYLDWKTEDSDGSIRQIILLYTIFHKMFTHQILSKIKNMYNYSIKNI